MVGFRCEEHNKNEDQDLQGELAKSHYQGRVVVGAVLLRALLSPH